MNIGFTEILLILVLFLILFGAKKLPEVARSIGRSVHEFKKGLKEGHNESDTENLSKKEELTEKNKKSV